MTKLSGGSLSGPRDYGTRLGKRWMLLLPGLGEFDGIREDQVPVARIFAAAPDLLAACEAILARANGVFDHPALMAYGPLLPRLEEDIAYMARVAIRKARGEDAAP